MKSNHGFTNNKSIIALKVSILLAVAPFAWSADENMSSAIQKDAPTVTSGQDPYETYNRWMFNVNDKADTYILRPVAKGYRAITPKPVRIGVNNFFDNLRDVVSFGSNLLRLDIKRASEDLVRVGINTTFGLGGLINIANAGDVPDNKNSLGDTFATWGWKKSHYFVYPILGPSTVRDSVGQTITSAYPVQNAIFPKTGERMAATVVKGISTREQLLDLTDSLDEAAIDKYTYTRDIFMRLRNGQLGIQTVDSEDEIDIDDLVESDDGDAITPDNQSVEVDNYQEEHKIELVWQIEPGQIIEPDKVTNLESEPLWTPND